MQPAARTALASIVCTLQPDTWLDDNGWMILPLLNLPSIHALAPWASDGVHVARTSSNTANSARGEQGNDNANEKHLWLQD